MLRFGTHLGMAFQIKDDLFDYELSSVTGKPKWNDIQEKKLTLPLISALSKAKPSAKKDIIKAINKKSKKRETYEKVYQFVHAHQGPEYAREQMIHYKTKAQEILDTYPDSEAKTALILLLDYIVDRKK